MIHAAIEVGCPSNLLCSQSPATETEVLALIFQACYDNHIIVPGEVTRMARENTGHPVDLELQVRKRLNLDTVRRAGNPSI